MKRLLCYLGGVCAAAAGLLVWGGKRAPNVDELAPHLEEAPRDRKPAL
jgi:hypothetical protein